MHKKYVALFTLAIFGVALGSSSSSNDLSKQLDNALFERDITKVRGCIKAGADVVGKKNEMSPLSRAADLGFFAAVIELMKTKKCDPVAEDSAELRPIYRCLWGSDYPLDRLNIFKLFVDNGADVNVKQAWGSSGITLLHRAARSAMPNSYALPIIAILLDKKADKNALTDPIFFKRKESELDTPYYAAAEFAKKYWIDDSKILRASDIEKEAIEKECKNKKRLTRASRALFIRDYPGNSDGQRKMLKLVLDAYSQDTYMQLQAEAEIEKLKTELSHKEFQEKIGKYLHGRADRNKKDKQDHWLKK